METKRKIYKSLLVLAIVAGFFASAGIVAVEAQDLGIDYAANIGLVDADPRLAAANIVRLALTFVGIIAVVIVLYGGFIWMTAAGDPARVEKAKKILLSAIIGLVIILASFLIVSFVIDKISDSLNGGGGGVSCTSGETRSCGCHNEGTQICTGGTWDACAGPGACRSYDSCCSWGCDDDCSIPPPFYLKATSPIDGATNVIANVKIQYTLNRRPEAATVNDISFLVKDASGTAVAGTAVLSGSRISFTPDPASNPCPANACNAASCLSAGAYTAEATDGILSFGDNEALDCTALAPCRINFTVGDTIDCDDPDLVLSYGQVCASAGNTLYAEATDDSGVTHIEFYDPAGTVVDEANPAPAPDTPFAAAFDWDATTYAPNTSVTLRAIAYDMDDHSREKSVSARVRATHCCNGVQDEGETGIDCGGADCAYCQGAACGINLNLSCADNPENCDSTLCASGLCNCGDYGTEACEARDYVSGTASCCICEIKPIIDWISPTGGFCDGDGDRYCQSDAACSGLEPATCNTAVPNGAAGNFVTIGGRNFGDTPGKILFSDDSGAPVIEAALAHTVNPACGTAADTWTNRQIVAVVPAGADLGPVRVEEGVSGSGFYDDFGTDFLVNTINRPGLCLANPSSGFYNDDFSLAGAVLNGSEQEVYFGDQEDRVRASNVSGWTPTAVSASVPNVAYGRNTVFAEIDSVGSNYLDFRVDRDLANEPVIEYLDPAAGPRGQYVTIYGSRFGSYLSGTSRVEFLWPADGRVFTADGLDMPAECQNGWWHDNYIIIKVPAGLPEDGNYEVRVTNRGALTSVPADFTVTAGSPGPGLCKLLPHNGPVGQQVGVYGDNFGATQSFVRFYNNTNATVYNGWTDQAIDTKVPTGAQTGPVVVSSGAALSNSLPFTVGKCLSDDTCDAVGGEECCASGTYWDGICRPAGSCNAAGELLSAYGWKFTTAGAGPGLGTPCYNPLTDLGNCDQTLTEDCASVGLVCDPVSCVCAYPLAPDSCSENSRVTGQCATDQLCPNSPGQCSPYDGSLPVETGKCNSAACDGFGACDSSCTYNNAIDKCVNGVNCSPNSTLDYLGRTFVTTCANISSTLGSRWTFSTGGSCPLGWTRSIGGSGTCYQTGDAGKCTLCGGGFSCYNDGSGAGAGVCGVAQNLCPSGSVCDDASGVCKRDSQADCECCCRIGHDAEDCCTPLVCEGDCGSDRTGDDTDAWGYCSGCGSVGATQEEHDAACNCTGSSGKFCDTSVNPAGVCRDCSQLRADADSCDDHSSVCCIDNRNNDYCRGGDGTLVPGASGYCAYYGCQAPPDQSQCDPNPLLTGPYRDPSACTAGCEGYQPAEASCDRDPDPAVTACVYNICQPAYGCYSDDPAAAPCGFCCCDMTKSKTEDDDCRLLNPDLYCAYTDSGNCYDSTPGSASTTADFGLCCGCKADADCGSPYETGCGTDACCHPRPVVEAVIPADESPSVPGSGRVCRNAVITAEFSEFMRISSLSGNFLLVGDHEGEACPENTVFLARAVTESGVLAKVYNRVIGKLLAAFRPILPERLVLAYTPPRNTHVYCAVSGATGGYHQGGKTFAEFRPSRLLDGDRLYYAILKGDPDFTSARGVLSSLGIGISAAGSLAGTDNVFNGQSYENSYIWSFRTLSEQNKNSGVCAIDHVSIAPPSYLFKTTKDDLNREKDSDPQDPTFDQVRDSDKVFVANAFSADNQKLNPVAGYAWNWAWSIDNPSIVGIDPAPGFGSNEKQQLLEAKPGATDGRTQAHASIRLTETAYSTIGNGETGTADLFVFICDNPWPPVDPDDDTWAPWQDNDANCTLDMEGCRNTNYEMYFCRDQGGPGTLDDLPAILSKDTIIRGATPEIYKEAYYFREPTPGAAADLTAVNTPGAATGGSVDLSWNGVVNAAGYKLYWGVNPLRYSDYRDVGDVTAYTLNGLVNGTTYYFNLTSYFGSGAESDFSGEVSVIVADVAPPSPPSGFRVTAGDGQATLKWNANTLDTTDYEVSYGTAVNTYGYSENVDLDTDVVITGLTNGQTYYFAVRAVDAAGNKSGFVSDSAVPVNTDN